MSRNVLTMASIVGCLFFLLPAEKAPAQGRGIGQAVNRLGWWIVRGYWEYSVRASPSNRGFSLKKEEPRRSCEQPSRPFGEPRW